MSDFNDCGWELEHTNLKKRIFVCHMPGGGGEKLASLISQHPDCNTLSITKIPETGRILISQPFEIDENKTSVTATHKTPKEIREQVPDAIIIQILIPEDVWCQIGHIQMKIQNCRYSDKIIMQSHADQHNQTLLPNDAFIDIPSSGHMAGLLANTDNVADAWFSPAGFNRGQFLGATRVNFNPKQAERDTLYKARVNPIVAFPGEGMVLFGDKTLLSRPSAFDRINVRRLFIVLEKAISTAAKFQLFEFNDEFTRAQFRNLVEPFLREVQGRRGITDFKVICDETNNTSNVIDTNKFVADIFIQPARSINFITLNFIATRTGVDFSEIAGT